MLPGFCPRAFAALLAWSAGFPALARPDVVYLKSGNRVEGEVSPGSKPGSIKVVLDKGLEVEFQEKDVREIEKKKSPAKEFDERLAAAPGEDIDALLELAEWAKERKLRSKEEQVYRKVLEIDPNDPVARRELGYAVFKNRWVKEADLRSKFGLVLFRGDWVTPEEKDRRVFEELKKEITDLLRDVDSDNRYIREYSIRKLLEYRDPRVGAVILKFLDDPREAVRVVAVQVLVAIEMAPGKASRRAAGASSAGKAQAGAKGSSPQSKTRNPSGEKGSGAPAATPSSALPTEEEVARALLQRVLVEENRSVRTSLANALQKLHYRKFFDLALESLSLSTNPLHRDRASEAIVFALKKDWMGDLIRALPHRPRWAEPSAGGNPQVLSILMKISREDFGYREGDWQAWWVRSKGRYVDEE